MVKKVLILFFFLFGTLSFCAGEYDKDIVVKNQSRNDKVATVFKQMMQMYEEEDLNGFFSYVSEDRFQQDYMTFYDAIDEDIRVYDILSVDTWINKTTEDGVKRFLNVQWEKRYESSKPVGLNERDLDASNEYEVFQRGTTEFLFDEINGEYKLIQIAGNNFWGGSLKDWTDEVGDIAGQESKDIVGDNVNGEYDSGGGELTDLTINYAACGYASPSNAMFVEIENLSGVDAVGPFNIINRDTGASFTYTGTLASGDTDNITMLSDTSCDNIYGGETVEVNPTPYQILEIDYTNNTATSSVGAP